METTPFSLFGRPSSSTPFGFANGTPDSFGFGDMSATLGDFNAALDASALFGADEASCDESVNSLPNATRRSSIKTPVLKQRKLSMFIRSQVPTEPYEMGNSAKCLSCGDEFQSQYQLLVRHLKNYMEPHKCKICGEISTCPTLKKEHQATHRDGDKFVCPECGKLFATLKTLERHMARHSGVKPLVCVLCPANFTRKDKLTKHVSRRH